MIPASIAWLAGAWAFAWPIVTTIGTIIACVWGVVQAWPAIRRVFRITDIIVALPEQLNDLKASTVEVKEELARTEAAKLAAIAGVKFALDTHIAETRDGTKSWYAMKDDLAKLIAPIEDIHHEVKHNGGTSIKDAVARIERTVSILPVIAPVIAPVTTVTTTTTTSQEEAP